MMVGKSSGFDLFGLMLGQLHGLRLLFTACSEILGFPPYMGRVKMLSKIIDI